MLGRTLLSGRPRTLCNRAGLHSLGSHHASDEVFDEPFCAQFECIFPGYGLGVTEVGLMEVMILIQ
ncbi:hypothetical protein DPMN_159283 [Dreissena polymorpha]|uniref:Uncharacterized protein n=1 Tax=Dreissena polymorpha TaxID=45954 RepID=A0A9D4ELF0_DREPO|nr:hypothetical protein DPMN_159283 [Dreissena polymorpha]